MSKVSCKIKKNPTNSIKGVLSLAVVVKFSIRNIKPEITNYMKKGHSLVGLKPVKTDRIC